MVLIYLVFIVKSARPVQPTEEPRLHLQTWGQSCCHWWKQWRPDHAEEDVGWDQLVTRKWKTNSFFSRSSWKKCNGNLGSLVRCSPAHLFFSALCFKGKPKRAAVHEHESCYLRRTDPRYTLYTNKKYPETFVKWIWPTPNRLLLFNKDIPPIPATKRACGHKIFRMCIYIYILLYIYICVCAYIRVYIYYYIHTCILCIYIYICVRTYVYIYIHTYSINTYAVIHPTSHTGGMCPYLVGEMPDELNSNHKTYLKRLAKNHLSDIHYIHTYIIYI